MIFQMINLSGGMEMIKLIGAIMIVGASTYIGFLMAALLKARVSELKDMESALLQLETQIFFTRTTLPEAFSDVGKKSKSPVSDFFYSVAESLRNNDLDSVFQAFKDAFDKQKDFNITVSDKDIFLDLAKGLGESDLDGHKKIFSLAEYQLKNTINALEKKNEKTVKMYRCLGFSVGAMVTILLI